ncbi:hypothetical protein LguiB_012179 [Lonicera macranthoides]
MEKIRRATHTGSWYTDNPHGKGSEFCYTYTVAILLLCTLRALVCPTNDIRHEKLALGYELTTLYKKPSPEESISSRTTNKLAEELDEWLRSLMNGLEALVCLNLQIYRIFLLGPSRHYYMPKCALTRATIYKTPVGDLPIDLEVNEELKATGKFELMVQVDEAEHSMEMHLPYLARVFHGYSVKVVPILVGAVNAETEAIYGQQLSSYVDDPANFFCVLRLLFNYTHYDKKHGAIHKSIEALDKMGMDIIETGDPDVFKQYLSETDNTICRRHPISVFLHVISLTFPYASLSKSYSCT